MQTVCNNYDNNKTKNNASYGFYFYCCIYYISTFVLFVYLALFGCKDVKPPYPLKNDKTLRFHSVFESKQSYKLI